MVLTMSSIRDIFDDVSLSVISFLENHTGVSSVKFVERQGLSSQSIAEWESANRCTLPTDYKSFLSISDGLLLKWNVHHEGNEIPLGCLHLNQLAEVKKICMFDEDQEDGIARQGKHNQIRRWSIAPQLPTHHSPLSLGSPLLVPRILSVSSSLPPRLTLA